MRALLSKDNRNVHNPKPVIKWAGGKTQLLSQLSQKYPANLGKSIRNYAEPFMGGGAMFFDLYSKNLIDYAILIDFNYALVNLYNVIKNTPLFLVEVLGDIQKQYIALDNKNREIFFYKKRDSFNGYNRASKNNLLYAAEFIFLNRTCFNGLFRVNKKGSFNVPFGRYINPKICDADNIFCVSQAPQIADIIHGDFTLLDNQIDSSYFIYYDPPYKPLSITSNFNSYSSNFNDSEQKRLADFYSKCDQSNILQMLSNSDPQSATGDDFFDVLYADFHIDRVFAKRIINANAEKRGKISEILITNYNNFL